jgi:hypothetical protein
MGCGRDESNVWLHTIFPTRLPPQPNQWRDSAKGFVDLKRHEVPHAVIACPCQLMHHRLPRDHQVTLACFRW